MKRKAQRVYYHFFKYLIGLIAYFDTKLFMVFFIPLLRSVNIKMKGRPRFIAKSVKLDDFDLISFGDRLVISSNVVLLTHDYSFTTGLISIGRKPDTDIGILRPISIGDNVFIGMNSIILPGTTIGDNVIVGAGSVVRGVIPNNVVIAGNPAVVVTDIEDHTNKLLTKEYTRRVDNE